MCEAMKRIIHEFQQIMYRNIFLSSEQHRKIFLKEKRDCIMMIIKFKFLFEPPEKSWIRDEKRATDHLKTHLQCYWKWHKTYIFQRASTTTKRWDIYEIFWQNVFLVLEYNLLRIHPDHQERKPFSINQIKSLNRSQIVKQVAKSFGKVL